MPGPINPRITSDDPEARSGSVVRIREISDALNFHVAFNEDGTIRLSDEDIDRIAHRVAAVLLRAQKPVPVEDEGEYVPVRRNAEQRPMSEYG